MEALCSISGGMGNPVTDSALPVTPDNTREAPMLTLLYTANLRGELAILPRLFSLIRREQQAAPTPAVLLDLGDSCIVESWICEATQGRAPFLVLDSMGYDGAVIGGPERVPIPPSSLRKLAGDVSLRFIVWNRSATLSRRGASVMLVTGSAPAPEDTGFVRIDRAAATLPDVGAQPVLGDVPQGHLARVDIALPAWIVQAARLIELTPEVPADPTIAAVVELVESEARSYAQQQGGSHASE